MMSTEKVKVKVQNCSVGKDCLTDTDRIVIVQNCSVGITDKKAFRKAKALLQHHHHGRSSNSTQSVGQKKIWIIGLQVQGHCLENQNLNFQNNFSEGQLEQKKP